MRQWLEAAVQTLGQTPTEDEMHGRMHRLMASMHNVGTEAAGGGTELEITGRALPGAATQYWYHNSI